MPLIFSKQGVRKSKLMREFGLAKHRIMKKLIIANLSLGGFNKALKPQEDGSNLLGGTFDKKGPKQGLLTPALGRTKSQSNGLQVGQLVKGKSSHDVHSKRGTILIVKPEEFSRQMLASGTDEDKEGESFASVSSSSKRRS